MRTWIFWASGTQRRLAEFSESMGQNSTVPFCYHSYNHVLLYWNLVQCRGWYICWEGSELVREQWKGAELQIFQAPLWAAQWFIIGGGQSSSPPHNPPKYRPEKDQKVTKNIFSLILPAHSSFVSRGKSEQGFHNVYLVVGTGVIVVLHFTQSSVDIHIWDSILLWKICISLNFFRNAFGGSEEQWFAGEGDRVRRREGSKELFPAAEKEKNFKDSKLVGEQRWMVGKKGGMGS